MSDPLCDLIAAVATEHQIDDDSPRGGWFCTCGREFLMDDDDFQSWDEHLAGAVVAELETHYQLVPKSEPYQQLFGIPRRTVIIGFDGKRLGLAEEWAVERSTRNGRELLGDCPECDKEATYDEKRLADHYRDKLAADQNASVVHRYVTDWKADDE
jgi:hypothetical protein